MGCEFIAVGLGGMVGLRKRPMRVYDRGARGVVENI